LFATVFLSLLCLSPVLATDLSGQQRVALVIGNSAYDGSPLRNPVHDARAMAAALREVGFEVLHLENASQTVMEDAIRTFGRRLTQTKGVGLFYFAGHGVQSDGRNYLIPVGGVFSSEADLPRKAVEANEVLARMEQSGNPLNLVILDACRNNPFKKFRGAGGKGGLAAMDAPRGSLIAFATSPGAVASDGVGENGVYTKHLLENIRTPGVQVEQMFKRVRSGVISDTGNRQVPWETTSIQGDFMFAGAEGKPAAQPAAQVAPPVAVAPASQPAQPAAEPAKQVASRSGSINVEFAMLRETKKKPVLVKNGDTLKSGDAYFFHIKASRDCYLYLFQVDATGTVFRLFPNTKYHTTANPVAARARVTLPNEGEVFYLDQTTGHEEFYFLASDEPVETLENLDGGGVDGIMRSGLTLRGPAGVKAAAGKVAGGHGESSAPVQEFTFSKSFVHALTIHHK
jgi:biotin carboxyl carrier protein